MKIRIAQREDLAGIVEIYNQAILLKSATADVTPFAPEERIDWFQNHRPDKYPIYVAEIDAKIVGWCSISPYRPGRMALRYTAEISYYIHEDYRRRGIASALVSHAIKECPTLEIKNLFAIIIDMNRASVKLLEKFGFQQWGHMPNVLDFDGKEYGHLYYGLRALIK